VPFRVVFCGAVDGRPLLALLLRGGALELLEPALRLLGSGTFGVALGH
jgi:hypothetical protein